MDFPLIKRNGVLKEVLNDLEKLISTSHSGIIEIVGDAGCGKTTLLSQLEQFLNCHAIFPQIISAQASESFTIYNFLQSFALEIGIFNQVDSKENFTTYEEPMCIIQELLISVRDTRKDILVLIIDDSHKLSNELNKQLKQLFDPDSAPPFTYLLLSGREDKNLTDKLISIKAFDTHETEELFVKLLGNRWIEENSDVFKWIINLTQSWPYYLNLILIHSIETGLISPGYAASLELIKSTPLPQTLIDAIKLRYDFLSLDEEEQKILYFIICTNRVLSSQDISTLTNLHIKRVNIALNTLKSQNWIVNNNKIFHPLLKELVREQLDNSDKISLHRKFLTCGIDLSLEEKVHHLLFQKKLTVKNKRILLKYAKYLNSQGLFFTANQIYEKLDPQKLDSKIQLQIGKNYFRLSKNKESKKILKNLSSPDAAYFLAKINLEENSFNQAKRLIRKTLRESKLNSSVWWKFTCLLANAYSVSGNGAKVKKLVNELQSKCSSRKRKLDLYSLISEVKYNSGLDVDIEQNNKKGIRLAKSLKDYSAAAKLEQWLQFHFHIQGNFDKSRLHGNNAFKYSKLSFNKRVQILIKIIDGQTYIREDRHGKGLKLLEEAVEMRKKYGYLINLMGTYHAMGATYESLGHFPKAGLSYSFVEDKLKTTNNSPAKLMVGLFYMNQGNLKKAEDLLAQVILEFQKAKNDLLLGYTYGCSYPVFVRKDKKKADLNFKQGISTIVKLGVSEYIHAPFHLKGWTLVESGHIEELENHLEEWLKYGKNEDEIPFDYYQPLKIILEVNEGNKRNALNRLKQIEARYKGANIYEYKKLYKWLLKENIFPEYRERYDVLTKSIDVICTQRKIKIRKPKGVNDRFFRFIFEWQNCIKKRRTFSDIIFNSFAKAKRQKQLLSEKLLIWDIEISEDIVAFKDQKLILNVNLLGKPELRLNGKILSTKDWGSRRSLEVLVYLILRGWKFKTSVLKNDIIHDLWNPHPDNFNKTKDSLNTVLSRIRKAIDNKINNFIITHEDKVGFNWDSPAYKLDIDDVWQNHQESKKLKYRKKELQLKKHIVKRYSGYLAEGIDGLWIEGLRSAFHKYYIESVSFIKKTSPKTVIKKFSSSD